MAGVSRRSLLVAAAGMAVLPASAWAADPARLLHDIGSLAGTGTPSEAADINDRGDVVGATSLPGTRTSHAFIMNPRVDGGRLTDITPGEKRSTRAKAVNAAGVVTGTIGLGLTPSSPGSGQPGGNEPQRVFVWGPRTGLTVLPLPPGTAGAIAGDINDNGTVLVVGTNDVPDPNAPGMNIPIGSYLWDPVRRKYTELPLPAGSAAGSVALAGTLDQCGGVAGGVVTPLGGTAWKHVAVVWDAGTHAAHELSTGGVSDAFATDRNEHGVTVGWRMNLPGGMSGAVYWPDRNAAPVPLPGRVAFEINNSGRIAGIRDFTGSPVFPFTAVLWEPGRGRTTDLGDHGLGSYVLALNASGRSAGYSVAGTASSHHNTAVWWDSPGRA
jgi:uncharacterized membrane protein